jgi:hypothetical protein
MWRRRGRRRRPDMLHQRHPVVRPELAGTMPHLPPGQWWSEDGWLHVEIGEIRQPPPTDRNLPEGWVWITGALHVNGKPVELCSIPVRGGVRHCMPTGLVSPASLRRRSPGPGRSVCFRGGTRRSTRSVRPPSGPALGWILDTCVPNSKPWPGNVYRPHRRHD